MSGAASAATDSSFDEVMYQCELGMISIIDASRERLEDRLDIALRFTRAPSSASSKSCPVSVAPPAQALLLEQYSCRHALDDVWIVANRAPKRSTHARLSS